MSLFLFFFFTGSGLVIIFFGILGTIILPDLLLRSHAATKCGITGSANVMIGLMFYSGELQFILKLFLILLFTFFTAPVVAHLIGYTHIRETYYHMKDHDEV